MKELLNTFETYLENNLPLSKSFHPHFETALGEMLLAGGKRFRPMLLLCVAASKNSLLVKSSLNVALGLEMLHTYSLIHDDLPVMDNADLRRGFKTLHKKYDDVTAVLVGDALNTEAFKLIADAPLSADVRIDLVAVLANDGGINGMIIGQAIDCYFENKVLSLEQLEFLHQHKTAKLIASSLKMGAIIANYSKELQDTLYNFGLDIGLLFQIQDDIIDETQSSEEAGKTTQNDACKNSFVNLLGLEGSIEAANTLAKKCEDTLFSLNPSLQNTLESLLEVYLYRHNKFTKNS